MFAFNFVSRYAKMDAKIVLAILLLVCDILLSQVDGMNVEYVCRRSGKRKSCMEWKNRTSLVRNFAELNILPGTYTLQKNFVVTNVNNFSIVGNSSSVTIDCEASNSSLVITNSAFIELRNIRFLHCSNYISSDLTAFSFPSFTRAAIFIYNVSSLVISNVLLGNSCGHGIIGLNMIGKVLFEQVKVYSNTTTANTCDKKRTAIGGITLLNFDSQNTDPETLGKANFDFKECMFFNYSADDVLPDYTENNASIDGKHLHSSAIGLIFHNQKTHSNVNIENVILSNLASVNGSIITVSYSQNNTANVTLHNCTISKTETTGKYTYTIFIDYKNGTKDIINNFSSIFNLYSCWFSYNNAISLLRTKHIYRNNMEMRVINNSFINNTANKLFHTSDIAPFLSGYNKFINNTVGIVLTVTEYMTLDDNANLLFHINRPNRNYNLKYKYVVQTDKRSSKRCIFQFKKNILSANITFYNNNEFKWTVFGNALYGCTWNSNHTQLPAEVFSRVIHFVGNQSNGIAGFENSICQCGMTDDLKCLYVRNLSVFPGQHITMRFVHFRFDIALFTDFTSSRFTRIAPTCNVSTFNSLNPQIDLILENTKHACTNVSYIISATSPQLEMCLLMLRTATTEKTIYAFRVHLKKCPLGFKFDAKQGICTCDSVFVNSMKGLSCDISKEKFIRPPNAWISVSENRSDIIYTSNCHIDYCILIPVPVQLNQSDDQCVSNRSGIACGECGKGLSAVFGTSQCKPCSNFWLFMIPVFALAGVLLVVVLFVFNLTVVDGDIYGFIFMVNALHIHIERVFPSNDGAAYILVSLANLDFGYEVCFYNGMTQYTATWLRFVFPIYVLLIVAGLAFASRYYALIERLTRKRVIPVIATLCLLSYNKIMLVTFRGLFSYTVIHHLYTKDKDVYWSKDTDVHVFGVKFCLLFVFCLVVFLALLLPANILLLFSRTAYRSRFIVNNFKPFLDVYHAPFKEKCEYYVGLEIILRAIIFACFSFKAQDIAAVYSTVLIIYFGHLCWVQPFKRRLNLMLYCSYLIYTFSFVTLFTRYFPAKQYPYELIFNGLVFVAFVQFVGIILAHIWRYLLPYNTFIGISREMLRRIVNNYKWRYYASRRSKNQRPLVMPLGSCENLRDELLVLESDV